MNKIPLCYKCAASQWKEETGLNGKPNPNVKTLIGCKDDKRIKDYSLAKKHCPLIK